jgi:hypothetical protein
MKRLTTILAIFAVLMAAPAEARKPTNPKYQAFVLQTQMNCLANLFVGKRCKRWAL